MLNIGLTSRKAKTMETKSRPGQTGQPAPTYGEIAAAIADEIAQHEQGKLRCIPRWRGRRNCEAWERLQPDGTWLDDDEAFVRAVLDAARAAGSRGEARASRFAVKDYGITLIERACRRDPRLQVGAAAPAPLHDPDGPCAEFVVREENDQLVFRCPHCRADHAHGAGGGYGSRTAHCWRPNSPYRPLGYVLVPPRASA